jgi:hypothetical protein
MLAATQPVLKAYQDHVRARDADTAVAMRPETTTPADRKHPVDTYLVEAVLGGDCPDGQFETGGRLELRVVARLSEIARGEGVHVGILIIRNDAVWCYGTSTKMDGLSSHWYPIGDGEYGVTFVVDDLPLLPGQYAFSVGLMDAHSPHFYDIWNAAATFAVRHEGKEIGMVRIPHRWGRP